ncbi:MAG: hypothetical protein HY554_10575 [Elusimicrobia bacterium]|nr:hypothetical protein [Elusimicrobiota bacterium]
MTFLERVVDVFVSHRVDFAVAGGYAVALHGAVRGTIDVDVVLRVDRANLMAAEAALKSLGLVSRLPIDAGMVFDFRKEYIEQRNLKAWSFCNSNNPGEVVDLLILHDLADLRTTRVPLGGDRAVTLVALDDLIAMKRAAGRPQDLEDVRALERLR